MFTIYDLTILPNGIIVNFKLFEIYDTQRTFASETGVALAILIILKNW